MAREYDIMYCCCVPLMLHSLKTSDNGHVGKIFASLSDPLLSTYATNIYLCLAFSHACFGCRNRS